MMTRSAVSLGLILGFVFSEANGQTKHALLVGCTTYKNLPADKQLGGPENDVELLRNLLVERFGFDSQEDHITRLTQSQDADHQPTRSNIEREFAKLAETVRANDTVVILLSGHGSQEPDDDPLNPADYEPDGRDETFLPSDIGEWNPRVGVVENSIRDDELRKWLSNILARGPNVWVIVDACHSGSGVRGRDVETLRHVPAESIIPAQALSAALESATSLQENEEVSSLFDGPGQLVAIYAAQPSEPTPERYLPRHADPHSRKMHGLLTFTLCDVLSRTNRKLTYVELVEAIQTRYLQMGKREPTPLIEGRNRDQLVLGKESFPSRSRFRLQKGSRTKSLRLDAGALDGLTKGTILAVHPPNIEDGDGGQPDAFVKIVALDAKESTVELCEFTEFSAADRDSIEDSSRCEVVHQALSEQAMVLGVEAAPSADGDVAAATLDGIRTSLSELPNPLVRVATSPSEVTWIVRVDTDSLSLFPSGVISDRPDGSMPVATVKRTEGWAVRLLDACTNISRAETLLGLSEIGSQPSDSTGVKLDLEALVDGQPLTWELGGRDLTDGQRVEVKMKNNSRDNCDVTVLYVDSEYKITCLYPRIGEYNRLAGGESDSLGLTVNAETTGVENLVVIAARGEGQPKDYRFLEQPSLSQSRLRGGSVDPLARLCETVVYGCGKDRGISREQSSDYEIRVVTWRVLRKK